MRDHLGHARKLGVHFIEDILQPQGVLLGHGKEDGLARKLARSILETNFHDLGPLLAQRVTVADGLLDLSALVIQIIGVNALLDQAVAVFLAQIHPPDARSLELCARRV